MSDKKVSSALLEVRAGQVWVANESNHSNQIMIILGESKINIVKGKDINQTLYEVINIGFSAYNRGNHYVIYQQTVEGINLKYTLSRGFTQKSLAFVVKHGSVLQVITDAFTTQRTLYEANIQQEQEAHEQKVKNIIAEMQTLERQKDLIKEVLGMSEKVNG